jgi:hypothetical protein
MVKMKPKDNRSWDEILTSSCATIPPAWRRAQQKRWHLRETEGYTRLCNNTTPPVLPYYGCRWPDGSVRTKPHQPERKPQAQARHVQRGRRGRRVRRGVVAPPRLLGRRQAGRGARALHRVAPARDGQGPRERRVFAFPPPSSTHLFTPKARFLGWRILQQDPTPPLVVARALTRKVFSVLTFDFCFASSLP